MRAPSGLLAACLFWAGGAAAELPGAGSDGWYAWRVEIVADAPELCCFAWSDGAVNRKSCNLDGRNGGVVTSGEQPYPADELRIYAFMQDGEATRIRSLSAQCPVTSDSPVTDIGTIPNTESLDWLEQRIPGRVAGEDAIMAIAMHAGDEGRRILVDTARSGSTDDNREAAIFWMGQARICLLYTSPSPRDLSTSRMPSSA